MKQNNEALTIELSEGKLVVPMRSVALALLGQALPVPAVTGAIAFPRIGEMWEEQGGIYTGIARGRDGAKDYHLITALPTFDPDEWETLKRRAAEIKVGRHQDYSLPTPAEQALQFANIPELFKKEWYWSITQHPEDSSSAYVQYFGSGSQDWLSKGNEYHGCAVRRVDIQPFDPSTI